MRAGSSRQLKTVAGTVVAWTAAAALVGLALRSDAEPFRPAATLGFGVGLGVLSAAFELAFVPRVLRRARPVTVLLARTAFYAAAAVGLMALLVGRLGARELGLSFGEVYAHPEVLAFFGSARFLGIVAVLTLAGFVINFVRQVRLVLGPGTLTALFFGRYRLPVAEHRAFLFLDLTGSTATAQRLGPARFNDFKNDFFADVAGPILATGGQIYQYVGDEVVVTWRVPREGRLRRSPVETFVLLDAAMGRYAERYRRLYGEVPTYKAGLHVGPVVTAEVGALKKDIVHSGDAVNVAARIEGACHGLGARLLVSEDALALAPLPEGVVAEDAGAIDLRGRSGAVRLFRVTAPGR